MSDEADTKQVPETEPSDGKEKKASEDDARLAINFDRLAPILRRRASTRVSNDFSCRPLTNYNVLVVGATRSGKSTFIKTLQDVQHTVTRQLYRGTILPTTTKLVVEMDGQFVCINLIDTPGFGEVSRDGGRDDRTLKTMVSEFVKRDVTSLDLVLLAVNGEGGLTKGAVEGLEGVMEFLGAAFSSITCMLVTRCEEMTREGEEKWIDDFTSLPTTDFLQTVCEGGYLFTGALTEAAMNDVGRRDAFALSQKARQKKFFQRLAESTSVPIMNDSTRAELALHESIANKYYAALDLKPELEKNRERVLAMRRYLVAASNNKLVDDKTSAECKTGVDECKDAGTEELASLDDVRGKKARYDEVATFVNKYYAELLDLNNGYSASKAALKVPHRLVKFFKSK